ncbi:MAG: hypothetical protein ACI30S_05865, partial [Muribaculaceae bacterium]
KNAGCKVVDGVVTLSPELEKLVEKLDGRQKFKVKQFIAIANMVKTDRIVFFVDGFGNPICTFELQNPELFNISLTASSKSTTRQDGYTVYKQKNGGIIVTDGNQGWFAQDVDVVKSAVESAEVSNYTTNGAVYDILCDEATITYCVKMPEAFAKDVNRNPIDYLCGNVTLTDNLIEAEFQQMNRSGKKYSMSRIMERIDPEIAKYIPDNAQGLVAIGNIKELKAWVDLLRDFGAVDPTELQVLQFIGGIMGTVAISVTPTTDSSCLFNDPLSSWDITGAVQLSEESVSRISSLIDLASLAYGVNVITDDETGQQCIEYGTGKVFYNQYDTTIVASNVPLNVPTSGVYAEKFAECYAIVSADVPYDSQLVRAMKIPYGFTVKAYLYDDKLSLEARINGSKSSVLKSLVEIILSADPSKFDFEGQFKGTDYESLW